uniref:Uncharacterized protein n=2 Tax=Anguilla anguilla TaxID=7936 RepID=A0A0E9RKP5_ANGAN
MRQLTCMPLLPVHGCSTNCDVSEASCLMNLGLNTQIWPSRLVLFHMGLLIIVTDWPEISLL